MVLERERAHQLPAIDVGSVYEGVVFLQVLVLLKNFHLVFSGYIHFLANELGDVHNSHGSWSSKEGHPCILRVPISIPQGVRLLPYTFVAIHEEADNLIFAQFCLLLQDLV